jgi:hypothetical protein
MLAALSRTRTRLRRATLLVLLSTGIVAGIAAPAFASGNATPVYTATLDNVSVNICSNSGDGGADGSDTECGGQENVSGYPGATWQCVEFAQRFYQDEGWHSGAFPDVTYAEDIYTASAAVMGMSTQANGSVTSIVPGDMIVHGPKDKYSVGAGHVAIVYSVSGSTVNAVQQNAPDTATYTLSNGTLTGGSGTDILGIVHSPKNTNTASGSLSSDSSNSTLNGNLLQNADFGLGKDQAWNAYQGGGFAVYDGGQEGSGPDYASYSGTAYAETNSPTSSGGFNQDIAVNSSPGNTYCATAMVRTADGGTGAEGSLTLEYLNATGGVVGLEGVNFGPLTSQWQQIEDCSVAITSGDYLRVLFQPTQDTPNLDVDDVDVQESLLVNSDFGQGAGYWHAYQGGGFAVYTGNQWGSGPNYATYSGAAYAEAYSPVAGGGFNQDIRLNITAGETFCLTAMVRTADGGSGASGTLTIEQMSGVGGNNGAESVNFGPLTNQWQQVYDCSVAPQSADYVRVIFLPTPNGPSMDVDDVDLYQSLLGNADFGLGNDGDWIPYQGGNFAVYVGDTQGSGSDYATYSGTEYAETNSPVAGGGFNQDIPINVTAGETFCLTAMVRTADGGTGASGTLTIEQMSGVGANDGAESVGFGPLTNQWQQVYDCSVATQSDPWLRVIFLPTPDEPNMDIDDVSLL